MSGLPLLLVIDTCAAITEPEALAHVGARFPESSKRRIKLTIQQIDKCTAITEPTTGCKERFGSFSNFTHKRAVDSLHICNSLPPRARSRNVPSELYRWALFIFLEKKYGNLNLYAFVFKVMSLFTLLNGSPRADL